MVLVSLFGAVLQAAFLAGGALVGPCPPGPGCEAGQDDPSPSPLRQVQVALAEHREPVVSEGPFIMNDLSQIEDVATRYRSGAMGRPAPLTES